jgi:DNA-binding PadR family transcriptional regulator
MEVKSMLLGFLMKKPMTGYELRKLFSMSFSFFSAISYGSIYPALKKMEREGLIVMSVEVQDGKPNRKVYAITDVGKKAFVDSLSAPIELDRHRNSFLCRLFFFAHMPREERARTATHYLEGIRQAQRDLETVRPEAEQYADPFQQLCLKFGERCLRDQLRNVEETIKSIQSE